jgi:hypothetical protein
MNVNLLRVQKLREYMFDVIRLINENIKQINVDMLDNDINNYSLDKVPTESVVEKWVTGTEIHRDVFSFRSRTGYSQDVMTNLENIGLFETLESIINSNNKEGILPDIEGIEEIRCLNCGTMLSGETKTAIFNIEIQITYKVLGGKNGI